MVVAVREVDLVRLHGVIEVAIVRGGCDFDAIAHKVAIEFHQQSGNREVVRRDALSVVPVVGVSERRVLRWLEEQVVAVQRDHRLVLVCPVELLEDFSESADGYLRILNASVDNLNQLLGVFQSIAETIVESFILEVLLNDFIFQ